MKQLLFILSILSTHTIGMGQLLMSKNAMISFHSHTFLENIDAENKQVMAVIDMGKKNIAFSCLMKQFIFPRKLMQEHFNENYVESDKFPKATFSGSYTEDVPTGKQGNYPVLVKGKLTLHGVTRALTIPAMLAVKNGNITGSATFKLNPADFNISIPLIVRDKIEKENTVKVNVEWKLKY